jgi:hypothetical protein
MTDSLPERTWPFVATRATGRFGSVFARPPPPDGMLPIDADDSLADKRATGVHDAERPFRNWLLTYASVRSRFSQRTSPASKSRQGNHDERG